MHLKQDHPSRKRFFSSNPYKIEVIITSFTEILELPNFGLSGFLALHISEQSPKKLILNRVKGRNASATALRWFASDTAHLCAPLYSICGGSTHLYVFMARSRVCKSLLMAELCLHRFVKLYIYIYDQYADSSYFALWELISTAQIKRRPWRTKVLNLLLELWALLIFYGYSSGSAINRLLNLTELRSVIYD